MKLSKNYIKNLIKETLEQEARERATVQDFRPVMEKAMELKRMLEEYVKDNPQHKDGAYRKLKNFLGIPNAEVPKPVQPAQEV